MAAFLAAVGVGVLAVVEVLPSAPWALDLIRRLFDNLSHCYPSLCESCSPASANLSLTHARPSGLPQCSDQPSKIRSRVR